jgi:RIO kinase 1
MSPKPRLSRGEILSVIWKGYEEFRREKDEEVFDAPTLFAVYDLVNSGIISYLNGVVSTGKEARVYWGVKEINNGDKHVKDYAVKVYHTSGLKFKKRQIYMQGDSRFKRISKGIELILTWARKEYANLDKAFSSSVPVPKPIALKRNVLVMEFIGEKGIPAPTLLNCKVNKRDYGQLISIVKKLYRKAGLVHADLSEYNIFKHKGKLILFDFGSAVTLDHEMAINFLKRDIKNVNRFFEKRGIEVLSDEEFLRKVIGS